MGKLEISCKFDWNRCVERRRAKNLLCLKIVCETWNKLKYKCFLFHRLFSLISIYGIWVEKPQNGIFFVKENNRRWPSNETNRSNENIKRMHFKKIINNMKKPKPKTKSNENCSTTLCQLLGGKKHALVFFMPRKNPLGLKVTLSSQRTIFFYNE